VTGQAGLQAGGLAAIRGERLVFRDVALAVAPGGALLLQGPNGAGKSTLLRLLAGLRRPDAGWIAWNGEGLDEDQARHAGHVAYLGHLDALKPGLSVTENLAFTAGRSGAAIAPALAALGLGALAGLPARLLSAGQKRRVALARLLLWRRPVWLLDEPTLGLDAASVERLGAAMADHRGGGGVIVAATHLPLPLPGAASLALAPA
jgi:heme exporter protein A